MHDRCQKVFSRCSSAVAFARRRTKQKPGCKHKVRCHRIKHGQMGRFLKQRLKKSTPSVPASSPQGGGPHYVGSITCLACETPIEIAGVGYFSRMLLSPVLDTIAPTQLVPVIRQHPKEPVRQIAAMRWGLIPNWARDASIASSTINATVMTLEVA